jgi:RNA binding exosome subunit
MILHLNMGGRITDIYVEAFVNATEAESRVRQAVANVLGEEPDLDTQTIEGTFGNPILVLRARISRKKEVERMMGRIAMSEWFKESLENLEDRLDEDGVYHLRMDKASAYAGGPKLWSVGESIEVRLKVATYPFSYSAALEFMRGVGSASGER